MAVKKSRRHSGFVICQDRITFIFPWILKTAVTMYSKFKLGLSMEGIRNALVP